MKDCMWTVSCINEEGYKFRKFLRTIKFTKQRRSVKLCNPDFKISKTMPQISIEFHCSKTGKQNLGTFCVSVGATDRESTEKTEK